MKGAASGRGSLKTEGKGPGDSSVLASPDPPPLPAFPFPCAHHGDSLRVNGLSDNIAAMSDVLHHFVESCPLHLLELEVTQWV